MVFLIASLLALLTYTPVPRVPDCLYVAYGCEYYIFNLGHGAGEALVTCDGGGTFSSYSGLMGDCPDG